MATRARRGQAEGARRGAPSRGPPTGCGGRRGGAALRQSCRRPPARVVYAHIRSQRPKMAPTRPLVKCTRVWSGPALTCSKAPPSRTAWAEESLLGVGACRAVEGAALWPLLSASASAARRLCMAQPSSRSRSFWKQLPRSWPRTCSGLGLGLGFRATAEGWARLRARARARARAWV